MKEVSTATAILNGTESLHRLIRRLCYLIRLSHSFLIHALGLLRLSEASKGLSCLAREDSADIEGQQRLKTGSSISVSRASRVIDLALHP